jgi:sporulation protein YlmC with PRC-barrel domain
MKQHSSRKCSGQRLSPSVLAAIGCLAAAAAAYASAAPAPEPSAPPCLKDLRAFDTQMNKDGYWVTGDSFDGGYGFPIYGYGYGYGYARDDRAVQSDSYSRGRPGYEVRTLLSAARILGQSGQQAACASVLGAARASYATYVAELHAGKVPPANLSGWRRTQIESAVSVAGNGIAYTSDQLIGADVINGQNEQLGSVDDIVMSPTTGKIEYLVVAHGGFFGIDEKYSAVPWPDFKSSVGSNLLILTVTKTDFDAAPPAKRDSVDFSAQRPNVDAYWSAHPPVAMN